MSKLLIEREAFGSKKLGLIMMELARAGETPESHNNALETMKMCQIKVV